MEKEPMIEKDAVDKESAYIYDKTLFDIIQSKLILQVKTPVVVNFSRRKKAFEIGVVVYVIKIDPTLPPFANMTSNEEKVVFVQESWRDFVRLVLSGMYEAKDLEMCKIGVKTYGEAYGYESLEPFMPDEDFDENGYAFSYFRENFKGLNHYYIYNGYNTDENPNYRKIYKK